MAGRKNQGLLKRLFPHSPLLRIVFVLSVILSLAAASFGGYRYYKIYRQEQQLLEEKERLAEEHRQLEERRDNLSDPKTVEKKAREELGLVKDGEVPYVK